VFLIFSCQSNINLPSKPKDLLNKSEMIRVMKDLILIESAIEGRYGQINKFHKIMAKSGEAIFEKNNITKERFERSFSYYSAHHEKLNEIYSAVLDSLNLQFPVNP
jgi:hypothetical protein